MKRVAILFCLFLWSGVHAEIHDAKPPSNGASLKSERPRVEAQAAAARHSFRCASTVFLYPSVAEADTLGPVILDFDSHDFGMGSLALPPKLENKGFQISFVQTLLDRSGEIDLEISQWPNIKVKLGQPPPAIDPLSQAAYHGPANQAFEITLEGKAPLKRLKLTCQPISNEEATRAEDQLERSHYLTEEEWLRKQYASSSSKGQDELRRNYSTTLGQLFDLASEIKDAKERADFESQIKARLDEMKRDPKTNSLLKPWVTELFLSGNEQDRAGYQALKSLKYRAGGLAFYQTGYSDLRDLRREVASFYRSWKAMETYRDSKFYPQLYWEGKAIVDAYQKELGKLKERIHQSFRR